MPVLIKTACVLDGIRYLGATNADGTGTLWRISPADAMAFDTDADALRVIRSWRDGAARRLSYVVDQAQELLTAKPRLCQACGERDDHERSGRPCPGGR